MKLSSLLDTIGQPNLEGFDSIQIDTIHYDSRGVRPGGLFVAIEGLKFDGHDFITEAVKRGASAIVAQKPVQTDVPVIRVKDSRAALARLSGKFYGDPSHDLTVVGITGTNGKTTTAYLLESMLLKAGCNVGVIGTVNYRFDGRVFDNPVTTPESLDLQRIMADMKSAGVSHLVMEASSHAIDLDRILGCEFDVGVFTNLSQDHLDYHQNMDTYWNCKKRFFTEYVNTGIKTGKGAAVVNTGNPYGRELIRQLPYTCLSVGQAPEDLLHSQQAVFKPDSIKGSIQTPEGGFDFISQMTGHHNLENILCAAGAAVALKLPLEAIKTGIESIPVVPGRLERVPGPEDRLVFVDYAHTPDALENVLHALKALDPRRLICVFGCGGERDRAKRPLMGQISGRISDLSIVTSDNPRTEQPGAIIAEILPGLKSVCDREYRAGDIRNGWQARGFIVEPDRRKAIRLGIEGSGPGDIVVIAGKGHETYQIVGRETRSFDDRHEATMVIQKIESSG